MSMSDMSVVLLCGTLLLLGHAWYWNRFTVLVVVSPSFRPDVGDCATQEDIPEVSDVVSR